MNTFLCRTYLSLMVALAAHVSVFNTALADGQQDEEKLDPATLWSAQKGSILAQEHVGKYYFEKKEYEEAKKYLTLASKQGSGWASLGLAFIYAEQDPDKTAYYYTRAAQQGIDKVPPGVLELFIADVLLGDDYKETEKEKEIINLYMKAADKGALVAHYRLGDYYEHKYTLDSKNMAYLHLALNHYQRAADGGYEDAQLRVAKVYEKIGKMAEALRYYRLVSHRSENVAELAGFYERQGDLKKAEFYYVLDAKRQPDHSTLGNLAAFYERVELLEKLPSVYIQLGRLYETGGLSHPANRWEDTPDLALAQYYYQKALEVDENNAAAEVLLEKVLLKQEKLKTEL